MGCPKTHSSKPARQLKNGRTEDHLTLAFPKGNRGWESLTVPGALFAADAELLIQELYGTARWPWDRGLRCHLCPSFLTHLSEGG